MHLAASGTASAWPRTDQQKMDIRTDTVFARLIAPLGQSRRHPGLCPGNKLFFQAEHLLRSKSLGCVGVARMCIGCPGIFLAMPVGIETSSGKRHGNVQFVSDIALQTRQAMPISETRELFSQDPP
jgi:hypothetical protein